MVNNCRSRPMRELHSSVLQRETKSEMETLRVRDMQTCHHVAFTVTVMGVTKVTVNGSFVAGIVSSLDIGLSNWSFDFISVSL